MQTLHLLLAYAAGRRRSPTRARDLLQPNQGIWVDDRWQLITGNNLNPRAWRLDLENAILIHDPHTEMRGQRHKELEEIREHTHIVSHYMELESIPNYPIKVRKLIRRLRRIRIDRLISRIL